MLPDLILLGSAFGAGAINAVGGGGTLLTFPALIGAGLPSVVANASSTVATFPGSLSSAWAYRRELEGLPGISVPALVGTGALGGSAGALLLLATPEQLFAALVPWLLLIATLLFAFGRGAGRLVRRHVRLGPGRVLALTAAIGVYGGYFGAGVGIMQLAVLAALGLDDLTRMNAIKTLCTGSTNLAAVLLFATSGVVVWSVALPMAAAAVLGGFAGAALARRVPSRYVRWLVIATGVVLTAHFFARP